MCLYNILRLFISDCQCYRHDLSVLIITTHAFIYTTAHPMVRISQSVTASISCAVPAGTLTNPSAPNTSVSSPTVMRMLPCLTRKNSSIVGWLCLSALSPFTNDVTAI